MFIGNVQECNARQLGQEARGYGTFLSYYGRGGPVSSEDSVCEDSSLLSEMVRESEKATHWNFRLSWY